MVSVYIRIPPTYFLKGRRLIGNGYFYDRSDLAHYHPKKFGANFSISDMKKFENELVRV